jgi:hypothetical protein
VPLPSGRIQARALMTDELKNLRRVKANGTTEDEATRALRTNANHIRNDTGGPTSTVSEWALSCRNTAMVASFRRV